MNFILTNLVFIISCSFLVPLLQEENTYKLTIKSITANSSEFDLFIKYEDDYEVLKSEHTPFELEISDDQFIILIKPESGELQCELQRFNFGIPKGNVSGSYEIINLQADFEKIAIWGL